MEGMDREVDRLARYWKNNGYFPEQLKGWRNERYAVFGDPTGAYLKAAQNSETNIAGGNHVFSIERAAGAIFGLPAYGVHMTAFEGEGDAMMIWVPKRSATKPTYPNKLDNTVAGGIPSGMTLFECLIMESGEEASLPEELVRARAKPVGTTTYFHVKKGGWLQPEVDYIYDLQLPPKDSPEYVQIVPAESGIESFKLIPVQELLTILRSDPHAFKPNCGLIVVDFLIRHGYIHAENEPN